MHTEFIGSKKIIEKKKKYQIPCSYHFYKNPPQIVKGNMQYLYDSKGMEYLDFFSGVSVMNCGHCNRKIIERTIEQISTLQHTTTIYLTQPIVDLAEKLSEVLPGDLNKSFFCMSGSEANEGAMLAAKLHTGKNEFIHLKGALHGRTHLTMSVNGIDMWRTSPDPLDSTHMAESFYPNVNDPSQTLSTAMEASLSSIENILEKRSGKIAALIIEPIQGNGGMLTPHKDYFKRLKKILEKHSTLLIVDEVQTGFGRTGKMFAIENFDTVPDIITTAKALGNGQPIAAFSTREAIANSFTKPSASTLGGNPVSAVTSLAVLDYILENDLTLRAHTLGKYLKDQLVNLKKKHSLIKDVRGIGLMLGAELVEDGSAASEKTDLILEMLKDRGFFVGKNGYERNVLAFQPPLVINKEDIDKLITALDEILMDLFSYKK